MLKTCEIHALPCVESVKKSLDLDNRGNRVTRLAEEFQTHRANVFRHLVQNPTRGSDDAVAPFFLNTRQAAKEFVGHILAQSDFAKFTTLDRDAFGAQYASFVRRFATLSPSECEACFLRVVNFSAIVIEAL